MEIVGNSGRKQFLSSSLSANIASGNAQRTFFQRKRIVRDSCSRELYLHFCCRKMVVTFAVIYRAALVNCCLFTSYERNRKNIYIRHKFLCVSIKIRNSAFEIRNLRDTLSLRHGEEYLNQHQ